jgi:hypothetical protein
MVIFTEHVKMDINSVQGEIWRAQENWNENAARSARWYHPE